jgi:hypothetical protein
MSERKHWRLSGSYSLPGNGRGAAETAKIDAWIGE